MRRDARIQAARRPTGMWGGRATQEQLPGARLAADDVQGCSCSRRIPMTGRTSEASRASVSAFAGRSSALASCFALPPPSMESCASCDAQGCASVPEGRDAVRDRPRHWYIPVRHTCASCTSRIQGRAATHKDVGRYDSMDGGGRAASGTAAESNAGSTTTGK